MQLFGKSIDKYGSGYIVLMPEENEDMWHAYHLITVNSLVRASTDRKVQSESETRSSSARRIRITVTIKVENVDYDTQAGMLRIKGRTVKKNKCVTMGAYHTLSLEVNRTFTLTKDWWDSVDLDRIENACDPAQRADVAAVVMHEGLAHVCLIWSWTILVRAKVDEFVPPKQLDNMKNYEKGLQQFFKRVTQALLQHVNFDVIKCVLIAGPQFTPEQFLDYIFQQGDQLDRKLLLDNKDKFLSVYAYNGYKHSLKKVLSYSHTMARINDTKAAVELNALKEIYKVLKCNPETSSYGWEQVEKAHAAGAIQTLLISDSLFRGCGCDVSTRKRCAELIEGVKQLGGNVKVFSGLHASDELETGIAAILRFPIPKFEKGQHETDESGKVKLVDESYINKLNTYVKYLFRK